MRLAAIALCLALPTCLHASDCAREGQRLGQAYKAYNDCSAAGRGATGCAGETGAYDAARTQYDECYKQQRGGSRPSSEPAASRDREDTRPAYRRTAAPLRSPRR